MALGKGVQRVYKIIFYKDQNGNEPVFEYLLELTQKSDKGSRIKAGKINDYIQALSLYGTRIGVPYVKHLDGKIWELRPLRDRILFAAWSDGEFVLLHCFMKDTQKTPKREIERAKRNLADYEERRE